MQPELIMIPLLGDERGGLVSFEAEKGIPFEIKRVYCIYSPKDGKPRGFHAHRKLKQVAVCITGSCKFILDNGKNKAEVVLDSPSKGLLIDSFVWREMYDFSNDCVLMVLANQYYDESDYVREYSAFLEMVK